MTDEELIARLKDDDHALVQRDRYAAADRIEALVKERDAAEQRGYANAMEAERKLHEDRIEALKAEVARLREALDGLLPYAEYHLSKMQEPRNPKFMADAVKAARAAMKQDPERDNG